VGNGLLYAAIVVVWAVVLVPMWLRRHEETAELRSVSRFSTAMRVLARREPRASSPQRYVVMPARPRVAQVEVTNSPEPVRAPRHAGRARLAARRRRLLAGLLALFVVTLLVQPLDAVGWPVALCSFVLLAAYLAHLRVQARRAADVDRRRRSVDERVSSRTRRQDAAGSLEQARDQQAAAHTAALEEQVKRDLAEQRLETERREADRLAAQGWQPVPVPLPTYVTKPKAPRTSRTIDLGGTSWAAPAAPAAASAPAPAAPVEEQAPSLDEELAGMSTAAGDDALDGPGDHRRAVND
jgi:hypothetical protein